MLLFLSFTAMAHRTILEQSIQDEDLDKALFFFGCDRSHIMGKLPGRDLTKIVSFGESEEIPCMEAIVYANRRGLNPVGEATHIRMVLEKAEPAGRVAWCRTDGRESQLGRHCLLMDLLNRNSLLPVKSEGEDPVDEWTKRFQGEHPIYSYPGAANFLLKYGIHVEVVY